MNNFITPMNAATRTRNAQPTQRPVNIPFGLSTVSAPLPPQAKPFTPKVEPPPSTGSRLDYFA